MAWVKLDDQRAMNLKLRRAGLEAVGLDDVAMCQVSLDGTDGFISEDTVSMLAHAYKCRSWRRLVALLVEVGRWIPTDNNGEPGWYIHDYLDYNPTKAEWDELVRSRKAAGSRGGIAKAQALATAKATAKATASATPSGGSKSHSTSSSKPPSKTPSRFVTSPLLKGDGNVKGPRVAARPHPDGGPAAVDVPIDPEAASKLRAVKNEMAERWGQKK